MLSKANQEALGIMQSLSSPGLALSRYRFHLEAAQNIQRLPSLERTLPLCFQTQLAEFAPSFANYFLNNKTGHPQETLIWKPPIGLADSLYTGQRFLCDLVLVAPAHHHFSVCFCAMEYLGRKGGYLLGLDQASLFDIARVEKIHPCAPPGHLYISATQHWFDLYSTCEVQDFMVATESLHISRLNLSFATRCRIKSEGSFIGKSPSAALSFEKLMKAVIARINHVAEQQNQTPLFTDNILDHLNDQAVKINLVDNQVSWEEDTQGPANPNMLTDGGFKGKVVYEGDFRSLILPLYIASWLNVGEKASLGYGHFDISFTLE